MEDLTHLALNYFETLTSFLQIKPYVLSGYLFRLVIVNIFVLDNAVDETVASYQKLYLLLNTKSASWKKKIEFLYAFLTQ